MKTLNVVLFDNFNFFSTVSSTKFAYSLAHYNNGTYLIGSNFIRFPLDVNSEVGKEYRYFVFG